MKLCYYIKKVNGKNVEFFYPNAEPEEIQAIKYLLNGRQLNKEFRDAITTLSINQIQWVARVL